MLIAHTVGFFAATLKIYQGKEEVARIKTSGWRERADLEINENGYRKFFSLKRDGVFSGSFLLLEMERVICSAIKPSAFSNRFEISLDGRSYEFRRPSIWSQRFVLISNGVEVGSVVPRGFFRRRFEIDLPEALPLAVKAFVFWLSLVIFKREQSAAAS